MQWYLMWSCSIILFAMIRFSALVSNSAASLINAPHQMCPRLLISTPILGSAPPYCVNTLILISTLALINSFIISVDIIVRVHVHWDQVVHQAISKSHENCPWLNYRIEHIRCCTRKPCYWRKSHSSYYRWTDKWHSKNVLPLVNE